MNKIKNKGAFLEEIISITISKYTDQKIAIISKIPTNINFANIENNVIKKAYFALNTNCDYIGLWNGRYLEFEAKETYEKVFKYSLLRSNQIKKLNDVDQMGGIAFIIVYLGYYDRFFLIKWNILNNYISSNKKSITIDWFELYAHELFINENLKLDFIEKLNFLIS
ncbi:Holliday junction resolvase RecU [Mesoplasma photuris]|uniref:Holliday junction resolvase RecU n=1 Tax=Mesoplasma photuris TaxID=217731 RepID=UPI0004E25A48|nr:Holliday junction resolvase RecU [Mesoplasma photuris]